ncbi:flagellar basal body P-ring formation chaperone FlgA [Terasakiella sp. A23]|uniref:flagellar basal body P-ring formation chaperone FlgA n=1 Tax=Terasakiella sp. FCG-A23 TaxID=3080561 RepID=UPI002953A5B4|nr:flagellar basal body P-ring formation chaperone FlgA [Terasakiella sp. A23]MDV7339066.1 flagellar basal body P-ring formation chaperone FlgA [Terasakiella sp. A23]
MKRILYFAGLLSLLLVASNSLAAGSAQEELVSGDTGPVSLRENIVVSGSYIRLGDLFTNAPQDKADTAVAYAPKPGRKASFDARWLFRVARAYGLQWRPLSADLRTMVTRDSITINRDEIQDALMASLLEHDLPQNAKIELSNRNLRIHVPSEIMPEVTIEDVTFNRRSMRFAAIVAVGERNMTPNQRVRVTGQIHKMIDVPTLARRMAKGEVIAENDIQWVQLRADRTQRDIITDVHSLIGMSPKRHLRPEKPIRAADIQRPVLVEKGKLVTIFLKKPGLMLTSQGRALQDGADGETIRITNTNTSRTVEAVVVGASMVTVLPIGGSNTAQLAFNN